MQYESLQSMLMLLVVALVFQMSACKPKGAGTAATGSTEKAYVAQGKYDEIYNFVSGGFSGQMSVYGTRRTTVSMWFLFSL